MPARRTELAAAPGALVQLVEDEGQEEGRGYGEELREAGRKYPPEERQVDGQCPGQWDLPGSCPVRERRRVTCDHEPRSERKDKGGHADDADYLYLGASAQPLPPLIRVARTVTPRYEPFSPALEAK